MKRVGAVVLGLVTSVAACGGKKTGTTTPPTPGSGSAEGSATSAGSDAPLPQPDTPAEDPCAVPPP